MITKGSDETSVWDRAREGAGEGAGRGRDGVRAEYKTIMAALSNIYSCTAQCSAAQVYLLCTFCTLRCRRIMHHIKDTQILRLSLYFEIHGTMKLL